MKIFLLEDDISLLKGIKFKLEREGYEVTCCEDYKSAEKVILQGEKFDLFLLDINLGDSSRDKTGVDFCAFVRTRLPDSYVIFLTARDSELDIVNGYETGADDYITKPFSLAVLMSKISALKRRKDGVKNEYNTAVSSFLRFDNDSFCVYAENEKIDLSKTEYRLLYKLVLNKNMVLTKKQLHQSMWNTESDYIDENTLAVNIRRLREKIEKDPSAPKYIRNVRGIGYIFKEDEDLP